MLQGSTFRLVILETVVCEMMEKSLASVAWYHKSPGIMWGDMLNMPSLYVGKEYGSIIREFRSGQILVETSAYVVLYNGTRYIYTWLPMNQNFST